MMAKHYKHWKDYPKSEWRWPSFTPQELACRGTGQLMIEPAAMDKLQALRNKLGRPIIINSGYRSPSHNAAVGGAKNSMHMKGIAFDCKQDNQNPEEFIKAAVAVGFKGIGTYPKQNFIHVDARPNEARWGTPFKKHPLTPDFAPETPRPADTVTGDTEAKSAIVGVGGIAVASGGILSSIGSLDPSVQAMAIGGLAVAVVALLWIFRKRIKEMAS